MWERFLASETQVLWEHQAWQAFEPSVDLFSTSMNSTSYSSSHLAPPDIPLTMVPNPPSVKNQMPPQTSELWVVIVNPWLKVIYIHTPSAPPQRSEHLTPHPFSFHCSLSKSMKSSPPTSSSSSSLTLRKPRRSKKDPNLKNGHGDANANANANGNGKRSSSFRGVTR